MSPKLKILFLCTGNSCRSQMAEGWSRHLKDEQIEAHSAGTEPRGLDPVAVKAMAEAGVDAAELEMAQQHLTGSFPIRLETNRALASLLLESVRFGRGLDYVDRYPARIRGLTLEEVNAAARRLLGAPEPVVVAAGDFGPRA